MRILREPLLHFVVLGFLVFLLDAWLSRDTRDQIVVTRNEIDRIAALWERQWRRPPTDVELDNLLEDHVREEILYREALRMGLDDNDTVVRRRLAQKIAFLSEDSAVPEAPSEAELADWLASDPARYERPARFTFRQIPFTRNDRAEQARRASAALEAVEASSADAWGSFGDPSMLPRRVENWTAREVASEFGPAFVGVIDTDRRDAWQGPLESAFGSHLVLLTAFEPARPATVAEARRALQRDWLEDQRRRANERFYERLRARYDVVVDRSTPPAS